jgi:hypothetical protein
MSNTIPGSARNCSASARNAVPLHPGILLGFIPERCSPCPGFRNYFNVIRLDVASAQCGADGATETVDTYFDSYYGPPGLERLLQASTSKVETLVNGQVPRQLGANNRTVVLLVNHTEYGGTGGVHAISNNDGQVVERVLHELAHSFGYLVDEYVEQGLRCNPNSAGANVSGNGNCSTVPWSLWASPTCPAAPQQDGIISLYLGANDCPTQLYRPTWQSKMSVLGRPFFEVNNEELSWRLYFNMNAFKREHPQDVNVSAVPGQVLTFSPGVPVPNLQTMQYSCSLDGALQQQQSGQGPSHRVFTLTTDSLSAGVHA